MHHIPFYHGTAGNPTVVIICLIAHYVHIILDRGKMFVVFVGGNLNFIVIGKTFCRFFHNCECLRKQIIQYVLRLIVNLFVQFLYTIIDLLFFFDIHVDFRIYSRFQLIDLLLFLFDIRIYNLLELRRLGSQLII